jgi:prepilin-type N-terminal cleavage/methylation domain-containing protein
MNTATKGFTLTELIVVISVIGILASVIFANINQGGAQSRDLKRQADLRNLQSALELYKNRHGQYPEGCQTAGTWSWQNGVGNDCLPGDQYIQGLAPEFISRLPVDPNPQGNGTGYAYLTNSDRTVYKLIAYNTVEEFNAEPAGEFSFCDSDVSMSSGLCINPNGALGANWDRDDCDASEPHFENSYAVWGGFADEVNPVRVEFFTEEVICQRP